MNRKIDNTKSSSQHRRRFTSKFALAPFFFVAKMLAFTTVLLGYGTVSVNAQTAPQALRPDLKVRNVMNTLSASHSIRIAKDPRNNTLYYLKENGEIYRVNLRSSKSTLVYNSSAHNVSVTQGMAIGPDGTIYLVGNTDLTNTLTKATIVKGAIDSSTGERVWTILAETAGYPKSKTAYDHRFNGVVVSPNGKFIYVNSGSRTDHGEVQSADGLYPNTREVGLTTCIFRLPTNGQNIFLPNNRATLKANGYVFAEGIRNTFDMAFAPNGDLIGTENGPDRDMSEELNWLRQGRHYGFPWRIGGADNPQQFPNYNPANDRLLNPIFNAVKKGYYRNDPTFPTRPNRNLTEPIINFGPDADSFRDLEDGKVKDASALGRTLSTFTAHRSPLGLVFDRQGAMSSEFQRDGFMLSWSSGDPTGEKVQGPFKDPSQDMLHLNLTKIGNNTYQVRAKRIVRGFSNPIDAEIIGNKIYVLEYGASQGIWEITMPTN
jgi:glucose/arabinose dehydrogenase